MSSNSLAVTSNMEIIWNHDHAIPAWINIYAYKDMMCTYINNSNDPNTSLFIWNIYPKLTHAGDDRFLYTNLLRLPVHSLLTAIFQGRLQNGFRSRRYCWLSSCTLHYSELQNTSRIFNSLLDCSLGYLVWSATYNIRSGSRSVVYSSVDSYFSFNP